MTMKTYTIEIDDDKSDLFEEMMKETRFVHHVVAEDEKSYDVRDSIKEAVRELNLSKDGQIDLRPAKEFLSELQS